MKPYLGEPQWLILILICMLAAWRWPFLKLHSPLRAAILLLGILSLGELRFGSKSDDMDLWVLIDRSDSVKATVQESFKEWKAILSDQQKVGDRLHFVDYAADVRFLEQETEPFNNNSTETRTGLAIQTVLSRVDERRFNRLLLLTDGYTTEQMVGVLQNLKQQRIALDYRLIETDTWMDYQVGAFRLPARVQPGQAFMLEAKVMGMPNGERKFQVRLGEQIVYEGQTTVEEGVGRIRLTDRLANTGAYKYTIELDSEGDALSENNRAEQWVEVGGEYSVLLLTSYENDPLAKILKAKGFNVRVVTRPEILDVSALSGVKVVVINNVAVNRVSSEFMEGLNFFVKSQGGGLMMGGGKYSFGSGGYFSSKIDGLIPVSMELRKEHRQLAVAMSLVLDRSGSMSASVASGSEQTTKMGLANEGAARTIGLLGDLDSISVLAVDQKPHEIIRQMPLLGQKEKLIQTVRKINPGGGGIYVYNGIKAGWEQLKKAEVGQRHMILFADAQDAEQRAEYKSLLTEMKMEGAKISVIGLGKETDRDAEFLKDIAKRSGGRIFFNENPVDLPALFAQETVTVARSAFIDQEVPWLATPGWSQIASSNLDGPEQVNGYNLSYLKSDATAAVVSGDSYRAPLIAFWQRGAGKVAAVTFPLGGEYSEEVRQWSGYADFIRTTIRWLKGADIPSGLFVDTQLFGNELEINFYHSNNWTETLAENTPQILISLGSTKTVEKLLWEKMKPGHYQARKKISAGERLRGVVQMNEIQIPFGPITNGENAEWARNKSRLQELEEISRLSGGQMRLDLSDAWKREGRMVDKDLTIFLLSVVLILLLLEAWITRMDLDLVALAKTQIKRFKA
ncbi:MAG: VWA domain-containing protein [Verrucomicrobiota bacterium]